MPIGNDVFISVNVGMVNDNAIGKDGYSEDTIIGRTIEDGVAIGAGATLLPGVVIGKESVVGAGSVVTKNVASSTSGNGDTSTLCSRSIKERNAMYFSKARYHDDSRKS